MIYHVGAISDNSIFSSRVLEGKLPADLINPLCAYSLNRKLRYQYDGPFFAFSENGGSEKNYPEHTPDLTKDCKLLRIYDQKIKHGVAKADAVAEVSSAPKLVQKNGIYLGLFSHGEYLEVEEIAQHVTDQFYVLLTAKTDYPRPAFGIWGEDTSVTIEPSSEAIGKFVVNRNRGGMKRYAGSNCYGCFYGYDASQNINRVMSVNKEGHNVEDVPFKQPTHIAIGRKAERYYIGEVAELILHSEDLDQKYGDFLLDNLIKNYKDYS